MAKKFGNDYRLWIESATPGTYNLIKGQQSIGYTRTANTIDTSTKDDFPYASTAAGLFDVSITLDGIADLPDTTGYTLLETSFKAQTAKKFQIRKGGATATGTDAVFEALCNILELSTPFGQNEAVKYTLKLGLNTAPTTDTLA